MTDIAIRVENLSKRYRIGLKEERPETFVGAMTSWLKAPLENFRQLRRLTTFDDEGPSPNGNSPVLSETEGQSAIRNSQSAIRNDSPRSVAEWGSPSDIIWALKDVSFEVKHGEVVGIIGRNGAGKSTLLKILSRITEPTSGRAIINGRVSSLLEVGTGFHPELTGRENVYLNGTVLGMTKAEVDRKFEEIVDFSGVEQFIDTPVKRYSSGMKVRLAFAVAAHLEPEILLVDEVLAVGDAAFQKKCIGKMSTVSQQGRTVLFVSHNMSVVSALCKRTIFFKDGDIEEDASTLQVITNYLSDEKSCDQEQKFTKDDDNKGYILTKPNAEVSFACGESMRIGFEVICPEPHRNATAGIVVYDLLENPVVGAASRLQGIYGDGDSYHWRFDCDLGNIPLSSGKYHVSIWFGNEYKNYAQFSKTLKLKIIPADPFGWGKIPQTWGHFYWRPEWRISPLQMNEESLKKLTNEIIRGK